MGQYSDLLDDAQAAKSGALAVRMAQGQSPDRVAEARKLAERYQLPAGVTETFIEDYRARAKTEDARQLFEKAPRLGSWVADPQNAAIASDDLNNLGAVETSLRVLKNSPRSLLASVPAANVGLWGAAAAPFEVAGQAQRGINKAIADLFGNTNYQPGENVADQIGGFLRGQQKVAQGVQQRVAPELAPDAGVVERGVSSGLTSAGQSLLTLPASIVTRSQAVGLGLMGAMTGGTSYGKARDEGLNPARAAAFGLQDAVAEVVTEKFALGKLLGDIKAGTGAAKMLVNNLLREIPGELAATTWQSFNEWANLNPDKSLKQWASELPPQLAETVVATLVGGTTQVGAVKGVQMAANRLMRDEDKAQQAEQFAQRVTQFNELVNATKLKGRDAASFTDFVQQVAEDGDTPADFYVEAEQLQNVMNQSGMTMEQLESVAPTVAQQLQQSAVAEAMVRIPVVEFSRAPAELTSPLIDHLRESADGMSRADATEYLANQGEAIRQEVERAVQRRGDADSFKAQVKEISDQFAAQLDQAGRFRPEVNRQYANLLGNFYATQALRAGVTPQELMQRYKLGVQAKVGEGGQVLEQGGNIGQVLAKWDAAGIEHGVTESGGTIEVGKIVVPQEQRGTGIGTEAMRQLLDYADATGRRVVLTPSADFGGTKSRLEKFYKDLGFVPNKGKGKDFTTQATMIREPVAATTSAAPERVAQTDTPAFKAWFGGSKVVDADGKPLVVYHGTNKDFDTFNTDGGVKDPLSRIGSFFSVDPNAASRFAGEDGNVMPVYLRARKPLTPQDPWWADNGFDTSRTNDGNDFDRMSAWLTGPQMAEVLGIDAVRWALKFTPDQRVAEAKKRLVADGFDALAFRDREVDGAALQYAVFSPEQIKSATGNNGNFDPADPDILNQSGLNALSELSPQSRDFLVGLATVSRNALAGERGSESVFVEAQPNGLPSGAKSLADLPEGNASAMQESGLSREPALVAMLSQMRRAVLDDPKVLDAVVGAVPVDVVNNFFGSEGAAKVALHDQAMLKDSPAFNADLSIAGGLDDTADSVFLFVREVAGRAAELARVSLRTGVEPKELLAAANTSQGNALYQGGAPRAQISFANDITSAVSVISLLPGADLSGFVHESGHFFLEVQADLAIRIQQRIAAGDEVSAGERGIVDDMNRILDWVGVKGDENITALDNWAGKTLDEKREYHEQFARGFEAYAFEGKSPSLELQGVFQRFRGWLIRVYKELKNLDVKLTDEVRGVMDRMIATDDAIREAQTARNMGPLFDSAGSAGMTVAEFEAYQALGLASTERAVDELAERSLKDMQWLSRVRNKFIRDRQREVAGIRADVERELRREIMQYDIYQAWQFLTAKNPVDAPANKKASDLDPTRDTLLEAVAKLGGIRAADAKSQWGIENVDAGIFGKPVLRKKGGLALDMMAEALGAEGYLIPDEYGRFDVNEFENKFDDETRGTPHYSFRREFDAPDIVIDTENVTAGRLNTKALKERYGDGDDAVWRVLSERGMTNDRGFDPEVVADAFGFESGDELVKTLAYTRPVNEVIREEADQIMLERYGDITSPQAIQKAADEAVHNSARGRFIAAELKALAKANNVKAGTVDVLAKAARQYAVETVARLKVSDLRPGQYAASAARNGRLAMLALQKDRVAEAAMHKRNQLVNHQVARATVEAQRTVDRGVAYLKKFERDGVRSRLPAEYLDQIDAMLERVELKKSVSLKDIERRQSLSAWIESQEKLGLPVDIPDALREDAARLNYKSMTVQQFDELLDAVKNIEHLGRLKNRLATARDQRAFDAVVTEIAATIRENGGAAKPDLLEGRGDTVAWLQGFAASHRKINSIVSQMEGGKLGVFWDNFIRTMNDAGNKEAVMIEQATMRLNELVQPMTKLPGGLTGKRSKVFIPEINASLSRGARLSIALNWGNETNRQRVMGGDNWTPDQVSAILRTLSPVELEFVNQTWEFVDSFWPEVKAKQERVMGVVPEKVEALPFLTVASDGSTVMMRGGYYPIKYDSERSSKAESQEAAEVAADMMRGAMTRATTRRGHTKSRVDVVNRAVRKNLSTLTQHVTQVVHDLAWHEWLIDANRILSDSRVDSAIREHYGPEFIRTLKDGIEGIATADIVPQTRTDDAMLFLRSNVSRATMGLSFTTAMLQPFGLTQSMAKIGAKHVLRGAARWAGDAARMESTFEWIAGKSDFMRLRSKTFNREINEISGKLKDKSRLKQIMDASLFMMMQKMQLIADVPTWVGQYEKSLAEGADEDTAIAQADQMVIASQGGGQIKDLAQVQRKHPMLTQFYSYFSVTLNLVVEKTQTTDFTSPKAVAGWLADMALLLVIPAILPAMLMHFAKGGDDDELPKKMLEWQASYLLGMVVGIREFSGIVSGFDYTGPPAARIVADLGKAVKQTLQGEVDEPMILAYVRLLGDAFGLPTVQATRMYKGWKAWENGEAPASAILFGPPPKD